MCSEYMVDRTRPAGVGGMLSGVGVGVGVETAQIAVDLAHMLLTGMVRGTCKAG